MQLGDSTSVVMTEGHLAKTVAGELVILDGNKGLYYGLNRVGLRIWELIQAPNTAAQISEVIACEFDTDLETAHSDTLRLLTELVAHGLAQPASGS